MTDTNKRFKSGSEFLPFHPQASHVNADYRDGWNACYAMGLTPAPPTEQPAPEWVMLDCLKEICDRLQAHPAYQDLTPEQEEITGGDTSEFSYLVRIGRAAIKKQGGAA